MALELVTVPCLSDNYAFLVHNTDTGETALIDAPEAAPIQAVLDNKGWVLSDILITHHHWDHVDGLEPLRGTARVIGSKADQKRLPKLDIAVAEGDALSVAGEDVTIFDVSGHTINHLAFYFEKSGYAFTADSLMALGCGRLFEGTPDQMWDSMQKLRDLPADSLICSGHEYTESNAKFAQSLEEDNPALTSRIREIETLRAAGRATVPSTLALERQTNPFLRADDPNLKAAVKMENASNAAVFAEIRKRKDNF